SVRTFPSTAMESEIRARSPSLATRPPSVTLPASIQPSICRREPRPAAASSFCSRSPRGSAVGSGGGFRLPCASFGFLAGDGGWRGGRRFKREGLGDFLKRRQLFQRAQPEVVEELACRGVERRAARRLAVADDVDPAAVLQRLDNL